jgi:glucose-6-phosphate 1-dehydrogenase
VVEKPFDATSPRPPSLNNVLSRAFDQTAIFRIDHYLGKESVEGLLAFCFRTPCSSCCGTAAT